VPVEVHNPLEVPALACPGSNIITMMVMRTKIMRALLLLLLTSVGGIRFPRHVENVLTLMNIVKIEMMLHAVMEIGMSRADTEGVAAAKPDADMVAGNTWL